MRRAKISGSAGICVIPGLDGEVCDEGKVVGGDEGSRRADETGLEKLERRLVVAVIERDEREQAREGGRHAEGVARLEGLKGVAQKACGEATGPFVEIADDKARRTELGVVEDLFAEKNAGLTAAFVEAGAEVDVEQVEQNRAQLDVCL